MSALKRFFLHSPHLYRAAQVFLGGIFLWAGGAKLLAPRAFARTISGWDLVPEPLLVPVALGLPALEFVAGLGLAFNIKGSLKLISGLLAIFLVLLGYAILSNMDVDCGCFSSEEIHARDSLRIAFYRDLGLMGIVAYLFVWRRLQRRSEVKYDIPG